MLVCWFVSVHVMCVCVCVCMYVFVGVLEAVILFMHACTFVYDFPIYLFVCVHKVFISFPSLTIPEYVKHSLCCEEGYLFVLKFVCHLKIVVHLEEKIIVLADAIKVTRTS
jgi:hypothetical protein